MHRSTVRASPERGRGGLRTRKFAPTVGVDIIRCQGLGRVHPMVVGHSMMRLMAMWVLARRQRCKTCSAAGWPRGLVGLALAP